MRTAKVFVHGVLAGFLSEAGDKKSYSFRYIPGYQGASVSLTLPVNPLEKHFEHFPAFFEGLLPEGPQLEALLRQAKLDRYDLFGQLLATGGDLVGAVTVEPLDE